VSEQGQGHVGQKMERLLELAKREQSGHLREFLTRVRPELRSILEQASGSLPGLGAQGVRATPTLAHASAEPSAGDHSPAAVSASDSAESGRGPQVGPRAAGPDGVPRVSGGLASEPGTVGPSVVPRSREADIPERVLASGGPSSGPLVSGAGAQSSAGKAEFIWPDLHELNLTEFKAQLEALQSSCSDPQDAPASALLRLVGQAQVASGPRPTSEQIVELSRVFLSSFYRGWSANRAWLTPLDADKFIKAIRRYLDGALAAPSGWRLTCPNIPSTFRSDKQELVHGKGALGPGAKVRPLSFGVETGDGDRVLIHPVVESYHRESFLSDTGGQG